MEQIPYFKFTPNIHEQFTVGQILGYLKEYDENLLNNQLLDTIRNVGNTFQKFTVKDIKRLREPGQGIITDGYLKSATLLDGFKAINRRGFYKLMGEAKVADIPNSTGQPVKTLQAPVLYTEGVDEQIYADYLNVGPLVNQFAYGFDFIDYSQPSLVQRFQDFDEKISYLKTIQNRVIYVSEQFTLEDNDYKRRFKYHPKHTVWFMFPDSSFLFVHSLQSRISRTERLMLCRRNAN